MRIGLASAGALAVVLSCGSALAEPESTEAQTVAPAEDKGAQRDALYEEGRALVREGRLPEALEKFNEVIAIQPHPEVLLWMGYVQERMGHLLSARTIYARALDDAREGGLSDEEHDAESAIAALGTKVPRILVKLPAGLDATVQVDKDVISSPDKGLEIDPGAHVVVVSARGRQSVRTNIDAQAGEVYVIDARLPQAIQSPATSAPVVPDKRATTSPLAGSVALGVVGATVAMFGATLIADRDDTLRDIGTGALVGGITVTAGALLWGLATYDDHKSTRKYGAPNQAPRFSAGVAPTAHGAVGGVGLKF